MYQLLIYNTDMSKKMAEYNNCKSIQNALDTANDFFKRFLGYEVDYYYDIQDLTVLVIFEQVFTGISPHVTTF